MGYRSGHNGIASKAIVGSRPPRVQIPPPPLLLGLAAFVFLVLPACRGDLDTSFPLRLPWLVYERTGESNGVDDRVDLRVDGVATVSTRSHDESRVEVPRDEMAHLRRAVEAVDWASIQGDHSEPGVDVVTYELRYEDHIVTWTDIDTHVGDEIGPVVVPLNDILSTVRARSSVARSSGTVDG